MTSPNTEAKGSEGMVLRREAQKAVSGRIPVVLSIGVALLTGVLFGYGLRASMVEGQCRHSACPARVVIPPATVHGVCGGAPRVYLLGHGQPARPAPVRADFREPRSQAPAPSPAVLD